MKNISCLNLRLIAAPSLGTFLQEEGLEKGRVKEGLVFLKVEKGRRRKGWFKKSFPERKMKEGTGFKILRRKG